MELSKSNIHSLDQLILHSEIPYEDVKIELLDHLATDIELRMDTNPDLSFADALRLSSTDIKENIIGIQKEIEHREIRKSVSETFGLTNVKSSIIFLLFSVLAYSSFQSLGIWGAPISSSIIGLTAIGLLICAFRMRSIPNTTSLELKYRTQNFWIPLFLAAVIAFVISSLFIGIIKANSFWHYIDELLLIPIALSYGFLLKVIVHISTFWIDDIKMRVDIDRKFLEVV